MDSIKSAKNYYTLDRRIMDWESAVFKKLNCNVCTTDKILFEKYVWPLKGPLLLFLSVAGGLTSESVQGTSLAFQSVDDIHGCDCLPFGVLGVGDSITDDIFQEYFQYTTGLFVDESRDTFDTTSPGKTTDGWLGDTLDIITKNLPVTLSASLS